ncbi:MAG TPA: FGGY family carbohydrate kinase [Chloroflexota bacterium]|nr:FGGY family carbohydrate kinase [Chloroflexota bacterium]
MAETAARAGARGDMQVTQERAALGIDLGSTNAKAMAVAEDGAVVATGTAATGFSYPGPGLVEMDLAAAWEAAAGAVRGVAAEARRQGYEISCVGLSALGPALVLLDTAGDPVRPAIAYSDLRASADAREIATRVNVVTQVRLTGVRWAPGMASAPVLRWIQREEPEAYARAAVVGHPSTFLLHRLTGRFAIDHAAAQTTGLFAYQGEPRWLPEAAQAMDVGLEKLPEPVDPVAAAGRLTAATAAALGLEPGIPVSAGANDSSCAAVALAILEPG